MNQKAKDYIRRNTLDLESDNRMDSTGYVQYAISEAKAYAAIAIAEEGMRQKAMKVKAPINLQLRYYFIKVCFATRTRHVALLRCGTSAIDVK